MKIKQEDDARVVLNHYISYYENQLKTKKDLESEKRQVEMWYFWMIQKKLPKKIWNNCWWNNGC